MDPKDDDNDGRDPLILHYLDPSPVDESLADDADGGGQKTDGYFSPHPSVPATDVPPSNTLLSRSLGSLGLSGSHGAAYYLRRIQKYSSYTFTFFFSLHFTNTSLIPLIVGSAEAAEPYLLLTRPFYQTPYLEPLTVFLPLIAHVSAGMALRLHRRHTMLKYAGAENRADRKVIPWPSVSGTSKLGIALVPLTGLHVLVNRLVPMWSGSAPEGVSLAFVAHGMARHPAIFAVPYIGLLGVASFHAVWGFAKWFGWTPMSKSTVASRALVRTEAEAAAAAGDRKRWLMLTLKRYSRTLVNGTGAMLFVIWFAGLGVVRKSGGARGWIGKGFDDLYRAVPVLGAWY